MTPMERVFWFLVVGGILLVVVGLVAVFTIWGTP